MIVFNHESQLMYLSGEGTALEIIETTPVPSLITTGGSENTFTLLVIERRAFVIYEEQLVGQFMLPGSNEAAGLSLVTDIFNQTTIRNASVAYRDLDINSAGLVGLSESGQLVKDSSAGPAIGVFSLPVSEVYARINLVSPVSAFSAEFSFGVLLRAESDETQNWLVFGSDKNWRFIHQERGGDPVPKQSGKANALRTGEGQVNLIEFVSTGKENKIYVEGVFLTNLALQPTDQPFMIAPFAGYEPGHQSGGLPTSYSDFEAWSFDD